ncbi:MAG: hypothetical protein QOG00_1165 [Pyrinomonadaceae bacterium]|nr:hypothetical protein [Pyrinomonadaceae bacterium]
MSGGRRQQQREASDARMNSRADEHTSVDEQSSGERRTGAWGWLFPATYAIHLLEELWGGEGFTAWLARAWNVELAPRPFLIWNAVALLLMAAGVALTPRYKHLRWLPLAYGVAFLLNALSHLAASLYTVTYSPGLVSGLLLWLPLGAHALLCYRKTLGRRSRRAGLLVGLLMHCVVLALTAFGERFNF